MGEPGKLLRRNKGGKEREREGGPYRARQWWWPLKKRPAGRDGKKTFNRKEASQSPTGSPGADLTRVARTSKTPIFQKATPKTPCSLAPDAIIDLVPSTPYTPTSPAAASEPGAHPSILP